MSLVTRTGILMRKEATDDPAHVPLIPTEKEAMELWTYSLTRFIAALLQKHPYSLANRKRLLTALKADYAQLSKDHANWKAFSPVKDNDMATFLAGERPFPFPTLQRGQEQKPKRPLLAAYEDYFTLLAALEGRRESESWKKENPRKRRDLKTKAIVDLVNLIIRGLPDPKPFAPPPPQHGDDIRKHLNTRRNPSLFAQGERRALWNRHFKRWAGMKRLEQIVREAVEVKHGKISLSSLKRYQAELYGQYVSPELKDITPRLPEVLRQQQQLESLVLRQPVPQHVPSSS